MKKFAVLIAPCILSPGFQAERKPGEHWGYPFLTLIMRYGVDVIPLPCAESAFGGFAAGLRRQPHGIKYYEELGGYAAHCGNLATEVAEQIAQMEAGGYQFLAMLGVENSPSCAVRHIYSNSGTLTRSGIFFQSLLCEFKSRNIVIPTIGVLRRNSPTAYARLEQILSDRLKIEKDDRV